MKALRPKCILEIINEDLENLFVATVFVGCWDSTVEIIKFSIIKNEKGYEQIEFQKTIKVKTASDVRHFLLYKFPKLEIVKPAFNSPKASGEIRDRYRNSFLEDSYETIKPLKLEKRIESLPKEVILCG